MIFVLTHVSVFGADDPQTTSPSPAATSLRILTASLRPQTASLRPLTLFFDPLVLDPFSGPPFLSTFGILMRFESSFETLVTSCWEYFSETADSQKHRKSLWFSHFSHSQTDHFFTAFSMHFWSRRRAASKSCFLRFRFFLDLFLGPQKRSKCKTRIPGGHKGLRRSTLGTLLCLH